MNLPADLIQEFAKLTNDTKKNTPANNAMYGTIVEYDNSKWVRIDGSDLLTPISYLTSVSDGDRVVVGIQNHTAIVNGNLSSPATTPQVVQDISNIVANKVVTEELEAGFIQVDVLLADYAKIKYLEAEYIKADVIEATYVKTETLEADYIKADKIEADYVKTDRLEAEFATIENLTATNIKVNNLEATYGTFEELTTKNFEAVNAHIQNLTANKADINDLNATNATVGTLTAGVANINTLIFGSATGDTIHVNFANAVIAQLGDAQIKSAMIESIAASKITAGDIVTNNVRVMSDDGKLLISDETIQISDDTRVRVQIGKDASDDYSINIWDADGNLMFSEGGISDKAIKDAIIRNDMVSNNANISASKLDIDSLFTEINGSSNTIKSTQIYLDDEKQTLNVAFKSMNTTVSDMNETVTSQGTQISVIQGQITNKIWQQDINTAKNELGEDISTLNTKYSELSQDLGGFKVTVSETYSGTVKEVRTYYAPGSLEITLMDETTFTVINVDDVYIEERSIGLIVGEKYTVMFDGVRYDLTAYPIEINGVSVPALGTYDDTSFMLVDVSGQAILIRARNGTHTISVLSKGVIVMPENKPNYTDNGLYVYSNGFTLEEGSTYTVIWNGVPYTCVAFEGQFNGEVGVGLGNYGALSGGANTGEPFVLGIAYGAGGGLIMPLDGTAGENNLTISIVTQDGAVAKPTIYPPDSPWSETEPTSGAVATILCTVYADGTFQYSEVSIDNAGAIAEEALAATTQLRTELTQTADSILSQVSSTYQTKSAMGNYSTTAQMNSAIEQKANSIMSEVSGIYVTQTDAQNLVGSIQLDITNLSTRITQTESSITSQASSISALGTRMSTVEQTAEGLTVSLQTTNNNVTNAAKTATNFLSYDSTNGLLIGNKSSGSWSGNRAQITSNAFNILNSSGTKLASFGSTATIGQSTSQNIYIDSDSVDIRSGSNVLATFKADEITLGIGTEVSTINLCGDAGFITGISLANNNVFDVLQIGSNNLQLLSERFIAGGRLEALTAFSELETSTGSNVSGDHVGVYTYATLLSDSRKNDSSAAVSTNAYAGYTDAHVNINATDGTNTSIVTVYPTYMNIGTKSLQINEVDINRIHPTFTPRGTIIPANSNLNTLDFIKIGNYYCPSNADTGTLTNCPTGGTAFMMQVYAPLNNTYDDELTYTYRYRVRKIITYAGEEYIQYVRSATTIGEFTYDPWRRILRSDDPASLASIEIVNSTPFIDFHFGKSTENYTSRIIENTSGTLTVTGGWKVGGALEVLGKATFASTVEIKNNLEIYRAQPYIDFHFNNSTGDYTTRIIENTSGVLTIGMGSGVTLQTKNEAIMLYDTTGSGYNAIFRPNTGGTCTLGAASYKWFAVYAANGTIQTSDRREKENIIPLGTSPVATYGMRSVPEQQIDIHSELFDRLQPVQYNFINGDGRTNYGLIAQDVIAAMEELGIGEHELGLVHHEYHIDEETGEEVDTFGIAYANLIALLIHEVQKLKSEMKTLKGENQNG